MTAVEINGTVVEFPDDLAPDQLKSAVQTAAHKMTLPNAVNVHDKDFTLTKLWDMAKKPEEMSKQGLKQISDLIPEGPTPTGNVVKDVVKNAPSILAKSGVDALSEVAPGFVSPVSLALMGAGGIMKGVGALSKLPAITDEAQTLKNGVGNVAESIASQGEGLAGMKPGTLKAIYKEPGKFIKDFAVKAKDTASDLYETAKAKYVDRLLQIGDKPNEIKDAARVLLENKQLNPAEAQTVLQQLPKPSNNVDFAVRAPYEAIKNSDPDFVQADKLHSLGVKLESAKKFFTANKNGTVSRMGMLEMLGTLASGAGALAKGHPIGGLATMVAGAQFSPIVQGMEAAALGTAAKGISALAENPMVGTRVGAAYDLLQKALASRRKK